MTNPTALTPTLDRIESNLPLIPRRIFRLQRAMVGAGCNLSRTVVSTLTSSANRVETSAKTGVKTVTGQARAEVGQTTDLAASEAASVLGRATRSIEGDSSERLEGWTKSDLYERAQELDIDGRSTMSKTELVDALRSA